MSFAFLVHLRIKFRAFGITFGTTDAWISIGFDKGWTCHEFHGPFAGDYVTALNRNGVLLEVGF